jgi:glycosyltransferase involved in cell wall biosynthesis|tara:strand:- start:178 stop:900 length:723 start_codon:yes stop_codon:yes gene_type:complete
MTISNNALARISCVLPVYNGSLYIGEALESIFSQSHPVDEVVVVDDGSTDALDEALALYRARITVLRQENAGPAAARNRGVARATGDLLAFLDSDDVWHPDKMRRQWSRFEARPELQLSLCMQRPFWIPEMSEERDRLIAEDHPFAKDHEGHVCQAMLMPRSTFEKVGTFNESLRIGEDTDWLLRSRQLGIETEMLEEVLFYRRLHRSNLSNARPEEAASGRIDFLMEHLKRKRQLAATT